jgi:hypothetical protein
MLSRRVSAPALALVLAAAQARAADGTDMLPFALMGGTPSLDLRLRAEHADNESTAQVLDSTATTLRGRLGFTTGKWNSFDAGVEYEGVTAYDKLDYNNNTASSTQTARPAIADPTGSELNQAWVRYSGIPMTTLQGGRVRFVLDNHRWVGNVGWRQNEQTYDGAVLVNRTLPGTELTYAYFHNVNSILFTNFPLRGNLVNGAFSPGAWLKASLYSYWLDFEAASAGNRQDGQTLGARFAGAPALGETVKLLYTAEYARQLEYEEAPAAVDVDYVLAEFGTILGATQLKLGYEVLGSNDGLYAVQTPLATLHAHDGWADLFLVTPATGLRDAYASVGSTVAGVALAASAHRFSADYGGADYGDEIDASAGYAFNPQLSALVKVADYNATAAAGASSFAGNFDTAKGWLQLEYKF